MVPAILGGMFLAVAIAIVWDHARAVRRLRLARLLDDPRYVAAVEILWERRETAGALLDAIEYLVGEGIERDEARRNLTRMVGFDSDVARLTLGRNMPTRPARELTNPWDRRPTPAASSAFILPGPGADRGGVVTAGPRS